MTDHTELLSLLDRQADEIAKAGLCGWGNTMLDAAAAIRELTAQLKIQDDANEIMTRRLREVEAGIPPFDPDTNMEHFGRLAQKGNQNVRGIWCAMYDAWRRALAPDRTDTEQLVSERVGLRGPHVG